MEIISMFSIVSYLHENDLKLDVEIKNYRDFKCFFSAFKLKKVEFWLLAEKLRTAFMKAKCLMNSLCVKLSLNYQHSKVNMLNIFSSVNWAYF